MRLGPTQAQPVPGAAQAQEAHFERGVHGLAGPPPPGGPRRRLTSKTMAERLDTLEHEGHAGGSRLRRAPAPVRGPRRLHPRPARRGRPVRSRLSSPTSGQAAEPPCPAGSRPARHWPAWSSRDPDMRPLDEPTNHLDLDALEWLEDHLRRRAGSLLVADPTTGPSWTPPSPGSWELRERKLTAFRGDYSAFPPPARGAGRVRAEKEADTWE